MIPARLATVAVCGDVIVYRGGSGVHYASCRVCHWLGRYPSQARAVERGSVHYVQGCGR